MIPQAAGSSHRPGARETCWSPLAAQIRAISQALGSPAAIGGIGSSCGIRDSPTVVCRHRSADRPAERLESVINGSRVPIARIGTPALLFRPGLLPRGGLGEDRLGLVVEQVAAAGAADP